ncbi:cytochrome c [Haloferula sp. BvORR071]|uniref:c-type cytochrome n=1 Tax=Haloferula sp. BvORR071 TaxID=1396141 RepID=UPI000698593B|nr:cytochrome c [Haloferula sp. BvORR071]
MSSQNDNPLIRFVAFWWALGVFSLFAVILLALKLLGGGKAESNPLEEAAAAKRYEAAAKVKSAQAANLAYKEVEAGKVVQVPPHDVFPIIGKELVASKGVAVKDPAQIIPGGPAVNTSADADFGAIDKMSPPAGTAPDEAAMAAGKAMFTVCAACHGMDGKGTPMVGPPLAGSEWVDGPVSNLIRIQFRGLTGPIHVGGQELTFAAPMMPVIAAMDDATIANVLTYVRNSFGHSAGPVLPDQVKALRSETGKPPLTEADLIKPTKP